MAEQAREAMLWSKADGRSLDCFLCSHRCHIAEGKTGVCRVRQNRGGTLYSLVYGRLIAEHMDPIEKKPLYHFLPGSLSYSIATPGCNFRCAFCQNWQISQVDAAPVFESLGYIEPERVVGSAAAGGALSVSYTYTEPTIFMEYALDCARMAQREGLKNVFVTNGFQSPEAVTAMTGLIDAANVDLKGFTDDFYRRQCGGRLQPVLDAITAMHAAGIHVEVTTLVVPERNDDEEQLSGIARFLAALSPDIPWHISRFHPDYRETGLPPTPVETMKRAEAAGRVAGLRYVYLGNVLLNGSQDTKCPSCGAVLVRRRGFARPTVYVTEPRCSECGHQVPLVLR